MRFYNQPHQYYSGINLHARSMFAYIFATAEQAESPAGSLPRTSASI